MNNKTISSIHVLSGTLAWVILLSIFLTTIIVEMSGLIAGHMFLRTSITYTLPFLIILLAVMGISGNHLPTKRKGDQALTHIRKWANLSSAATILILVLSAITLQQLSTSGGIFFLVQAIELGSEGLSLYLLASMLHKNFLSVGKLPAENSPDEPVMAAPEVIEERRVAPL